MAEPKTVTVAETKAGETVVINNKKDGLKKYSIFFAAVVISALIQGVKAAFPKFSGVVDVILDVASAAFPAIGAMFLTSPLDQRGLVINKDGTVTGDKIGIPNPPSAPGSTGVGISMLLLCLGLFAFIGTGCVNTTSRTPQGCPATLRTYPVVPIATATKVTPTAKVATVGLKNPGAQPGEIFSAAQGGASCQQKLTADGWITICPQPDDGDAFDSRNQARANAIAEFPNLLGSP